MRFAWIVCCKDLRQRLRDRTALLVAVVVPLTLAALVGLALGSNDAAIRLRLALVDQDASEASRDLRAFLARPWLADVIEVEDVATPEVASERLASDDADAGLVLRAGFAHDPGPPERPSLEVLSRGDNPFAARMMVGLSERFLASRSSPDRDAPLPETLQLSPGGRLRPVDFYALSMTVLFLTFTVLSGVRSLQHEVDAGVMARLVACPVDPRAILAGKLLALVLLGLLQMGVMIAATRLLFGTPWGQPLPLLALVGSSVLMAIGMTAFFMSVSANAEQGQMLASISIFLLAIIGGQFMPPQGLPDYFDVLQRLTPNGQAARGFMDVAAAGPTGTLATVWEPLAVTLVVGLAGILFAARRASAALARGV